MKIVYRAENIIDANLLKNALEHEGIPSFVGGEYLTGGAGQLPVRDVVVVLVADHDVERADPIARALDAALRVRPENDSESGFDWAPEPGSAPA